jgi:hypothetical protein
LKLLKHRVRTTSNCSIGSNDGKWEGKQHNLQYFYIFDAYHTTSHAVINSSITHAFHLPLFAWLVFLLLSWVNGQRRFNFWWLQILILINLIWGIYLSVNISVTYFLSNFF